MEKYVIGHRKEVFRIFHTAYCFDFCKKNNC